MNIQKELQRIAKALVAYEYAYDPEHKNKPEGTGWKQTDAGWAKGDKEEPKEEKWEGKKDGEYYYDAMESEGEGDRDPDENIWDEPEDSEDDE